MKKVKDQTEVLQSRHQETLKKTGIKGQTTVLRNDDNCSNIECQEVGMDHKYYLVPACSVRAGTPPIRPVH